jgi:hypothetical protein
MWLVAFMPLVAWANPVIPPQHKVAAWLLLAFGAEVAVEVLILRWQEIWIKASLRLLLMHALTFPGLGGLLGFLGHFEWLPPFVAIFIAEAAIVVIEATIFYVAAISSTRLTRGFLRCLIASAVGNLVSFLYGCAATYGWAASLPDR